MDTVTVQNAFKQFEALVKDGYPRRGRTITKAEFKTRMETFVAQAIKLVDDAGLYDHQYRKHLNEVTALAVDDFDNSGYTKSEDCKGHVSHLLHALEMTSPTYLADQAKDIADMIEAVQERLTHIKDRLREPIDESVLQDCDDKMTLTHNKVSSVFSKLDALARESYWFKSKRA